MTARGKIAARPAAARAELVEHEGLEAELAVLHRDDGDGHDSLRHHADGDGHEEDREDLAYARRPGLRAQDSGLGTHSPGSGGAS